MSLEERFISFDSRFDSVEKRMETFGEEVKKMRFEITELSRKVKKGLEMKTRIDNLTVRVEKLEEKIAA